MKQAQVALEFILFIILGIFLVLVLVGVAATLTSRTLDDQGSQELEDLAYSLQEEFILAAQVHPGYHRALNLPENLKRGAYTISNTEDSFTLERKGVIITLSTPRLNGTLKKGLNVIKKENETLIIT